MNNLLSQYFGLLPIADVADEVSRTLAEQQAVVVTAPPGAGKSTLLPLTLLHDAPVEGKILMLEPRRLAARQIAERMAEMLGEPVGKTVGYRIRFETRVSQETRIEVLTEGILTRMLESDPTLDGVGIVIFDEFHERSLHSDLALALTRQAQQILRPDLRLLVMSATIDTTAICEALQAPLIESQGRMFPVEIHYAKEDTDRRDMPQAAASAVRRALQEQEGDILVFLPGQAEIMRCAEMLKESSESILPLYGNLPPAEQRRAIRPPSDSPLKGEKQRRVVLATPIAETSLTIEGVRVVIDSGLCKTLVFDQRTGLSHLETVTISMDMAKQRAGRAGRLSPGVCYRLWTKAAEHRMAEQRKAEIEDADLAPMLLDIAAFGETDATALPWLTPPPTQGLAAARQLLLSLGAIDGKGAITPLGKKMVKLPCHPRIARMILHASTLGEVALACDIAALLEEKDPLTGQECSADIALRMRSLPRPLPRRGELSRSASWQRIIQVSEAYRKIAPLQTSPRGGRLPLFPSSSGEGIGEGALLAYAYPERVAMQMDKAGRYRLASGDEVRIDRSDPLSACPWLVIAKFPSISSKGENSSTLRGGWVGSSVEPSDLEELATERDLVTWNSSQDCLLMQHEWRIGRLLLRSKPIHDAPRDLQERVLCEAVAKDGLSMLSWSDEVSALQRRVAQVAAWHPEMDIPDLSTPHLLASAQEWLPLYLDDGGRLRTTGAALRKINLCDALWAFIPYGVQQQIERLAPSHIVVPTGNRIRLDYRVGAEAPVLSVRLQECFGMKETPKVDDGRVPVLMELLSPGYKPVQLTSDLGSFWQNTYFEVRGELRRRYPKHYWPDNPLEAEPTARAKKRAVS
ncbi:MAG: ATP-dependent helicase HrpB [Bacteroidaceae bacterium]|nr:ATP-dependent helicase HrpB [Bacteroidaceae bacterium]